MKILTLDQASRITKLAVTRLADFIQKGHIKNLVLGISGGLDSAVMAAIGLRAIRYLHTQSYECSYTFVFIDVQSKPDDLKKARELAKKFNFKLLEVDLNPEYLAWKDRIVNPVTHEDRLHNGNIKCRMRMIRLYSIAGDTHGIVLDTDDLSEFWMGFWTIHGDEGDVKVLQHLTKDEVRDLGEVYEVPASILESPPGDGLGVTLTNQASDQLGMEYLKINYLMSQLIRYGFNYNGDWGQLENDQFLWLFNKIAEEIHEPLENVLRVIKQSLRTAFKRVNGDRATMLLPSRTEMGLPEPGSEAFGKLYLQAIQNSF